MKNKSGVVWFDDVIAVARCVFDDEVDKVIRSSHGGLVSQNAPTVWHRIIGSVVDDEIDGYVHKVVSMKFGSKMDDITDNEMREFCCSEKFERMVRAGVKPWIEQFLDDYVNIMEME